MRIEKIEWLDASSNTGWDSRTAYEKTFDVDLTVVSVGYIVHETDDRVVMLMTHSYADGLYDVSLVLPKACIVSRVRLSSESNAAVRAV